MNLEELQLMSNYITHLPESFFQLSSLKRLYLSNNLLNTIPDIICKLNSLTFIDLRGNKLKAIPESIGELKNLEELKLEGNEIENLPESLKKNRALNLLNLDLNPIDKTKGSRNLKIIEQIQEQGIFVYLPDNEVYDIPEYLVLDRELIISALSNEWQPISSLVRKLGVKTMMDARFLRLKIKEFERKGEIEAEIMFGKKYWKLSTKRNIK